MHNRVTGLLDRIDDWEKVFAQEGSGAKTAIQGNGANAEVCLNKSPSLFQCGGQINRSEFNFTISV